MKINVDTFGKKYEKVFGTEKERIRKRNALKCPCELSKECKMYIKYGNYILECMAPQLGHKDL